MADVKSGLLSFLSEKVPKHIMDRFEERENQVVVTELSAVLVALLTWREELAGRDLVVLVDAEAVEAALVKGTSAAADLGHLIELVWKVAVEAKVAVYFDRVPTDANLSDGPSRGFLDELRRRGAVRCAAGGAVRGLGGTSRPRWGSPIPR